MLEVLESVVDHDFVYIFPRVLGEQTHFRGLPSERSKDAAQDLGTLVMAHLRKSHRQVVHTYSPQPQVQEVNDPSERDASGAGQRTRQRAYEFDDQPGKGVLEALTHVGGTCDGSTGEIL